MTYTTRIKGKTYMVGSLAEASKLYCQLRDKSGQGASRFGDAIVNGADGAFAARISYNGRVWAQPEWLPNQVPLMEAAR